jgi:hypothetical protein
MMDSAGPTKQLGEPELRPAETSFCRIAKPFQWSVRDTDDSIRQAKSHNAVGVALCAWGGPEDPPH